MRWIILLLPILLFATAATCTDTDTETNVDSRQGLYNQFLDVARQQLRETDPDLYCEPDYQLLLAEGATDVGGEQALIQAAMSDACKEGGHYSGAAQFSPYYADAP